MKKWILCMSVLVSMSLLSQGQTGNIAYSDLPVVVRNTIEEDLPGLDLSSFLKSIQALSGSENYVITFSDNVPIGPYLGLQKIVLTNTGEMRQMGYSYSQDQVSTVLPSDQLSKIETSLEGNLLDELYKLKSSTGSITYRAFTSDRSYVFNSNMDFLRSAPRN